MLALEIIFWIAVGLIVYTLFIYPLLALLLAVIIRKKVDKQPIEPKVSFIIAAYNEEDVIAEKIQQTLELDYPAEKLEIIVASDGSTDRTDEIVQSFADRGVKLSRVEGRLGKTHALNETVNVATGDILIFSDATGMYNRQAIRELVANFNDPTVGCVTGRVAYTYGKDTISVGFRGYQNIAVAIRRAESDFGSQTTVSGSIHAIRSEIYKPAHPDFSSDAIDAINTVVAGYRVLYENNAVSQEESRTTARDEFRCRIRIGIHATTMIPYILSQLIRHMKFGYLFQMISHKFMRWYLWLFLLGAFSCNLALALQGDSFLYLTLFRLQVAFYATAIFGLLLSRWGIGIPLLSTLAFFLLGVSGSCIGSLQCITGKRMATWEPVR
ncbi:MAG: glycosyltransferase family 2 protein [Planctomycetota bacterium]|nr:MAG: glycosyltransferase family 2 protein [Planctomycetota bacterium]